MKLNFILPLNSTGLGLGGLVAKLYNNKQIMDFILKNILSRLKKSLLSYLEY